MIDLFDIVDRVFNPKNPYGTYDPDYDYDEADGEIFPATFGTEILESGWFQRLNDFVDKFQKKFEEPKKEERKNISAPKQKAPSNAGVSAPKANGFDSFKRILNFDTPRATGQKGQKGQAGQEGGPGLNFFKEINGDSIANVVKNFKIFNGSNKAEKSTEDIAQTGFNTGFCPEGKGFEGSFSAKNSPGDSLRADTGRGVTSQNNQNNFSFMNINFSQASDIDEFGKTFSVHLTEAGKNTSVADKY